MIFLTKSQGFFLKALTLLLLTTSIFTACEKEDSALNEEIRLSEHVQQTADFANNNNAHDLEVRLFKKCKVELEEVLIPCFEEGGPGGFSVRGKYVAEIKGVCNKTVSKWAWTVNDGSFSQHIPDVHYIETNSANVWYYPDASVHLNYLTITVYAIFTDGTTSASDSITRFMDCDD